MVGDIDWKLIEAPVGTGILYKKTGRQVAQGAYRLEHFGAIKATRSGIRVGLKRVEGRVDMGEKFGIWGGLSERERRRVRRERAVRRAG